MKIIHNKIRGGQFLVFEQGALICGDLEQDVYITLKRGHLYVLGTIRGKVECLDQNSCIYCQKMEGAMICFGGIWLFSFAI